MGIEPVKHALKRPKIEEYHSYRQFLADFFAYKKSLRATFSYRRLSDLVGTKSPNFLLLVIQGKRNMSEKIGESVAKVFELTLPEKDYFLALVRKENAENAAQLEEADHALLRALSKLTTKEITRGNTEILARWFHLVVRELVFLPDFNPSGEWISNRLNQLITPEEAHKSLDFLLRTGFLKKDDAGKWQATDPVVDTGEHFSNASVLRTHLETMAVWQSILPGLPENKRELGLLNIPISSAKIPEFKKRIRAFQDEIVGWLQSETEFDEVVQLGCYLIPLTEKRDGSTS
jgi:uncharacterized protein (TIGR02147 family)